MISSGVRIFLQARFQPQRAFQVEIVGRLVEQEQIGLGEQRGGERYPHAPAAGKLRHRAFEIGVGEAKAGENFRSARRRTVGIDGVELVINLRHLFGRCGFERGVECFAPRVGGEDRVDQRDRRRRVFLIDRTDLRRFRQQDFAAQRHQIAENHPEQRRLADAVASDQADFGSRTEWRRWRESKNRRPQASKSRFSIRSMVRSPKSACREGEGRLFSARRLR